MNGGQWCVLALIEVGIVVVANGLHAGDLVVDTDFEGGSARVVEIDQEKSAITVMPGGDPERGWPAWWYFRVNGLTEGQPLTVSVVGSSRLIPQGHPGGGKPLSSSWARPSRATWSADGKTWHQSEEGQRDKAKTTYQLTAPGETMWIAWGPPSTPSMVNEWAEAIAAKHSFIQDFTLATTREGREVRGIRVENIRDGGTARPVVWFHARQHAWESGSSWVAMGIGEWLAGDSDDAKWMRENLVTYIVPIMDVDRAATGDGGKESVPHDHNRDWSTNPHYPEVAATQKRIAKWSKEERLALFVDLHNPGPSDGNAFFYVAPNEAIEVSRRPHRSVFLDVISREYDGRISLNRKTRSTGPSYHPLWHQISATWVTQHSNPQAISVCLETPWNTAHSNTKGYYSVGAGLMKGASKFLQTEFESSESAN
ncbi:Zinc carboxypeptidase [Roseimaritima multifibrata]|uniref:Zinc carboxypeptidase n=1 Tax=Roseimaritima multifibrata TaxID=1930274 RepID=A0A517MGI5_9BACT|nr:M14-type cytosolic carboxypeptidase [Roseimaritima multifibrata]QDS93998.1 Zinc carboxypeptidase [Roseimaritima multifibrata]